MLPVTKELGVDRQLAHLWRGNGRNSCSETSRIGQGAFGGHVIALYLLSIV